MMQSETETSSQSRYRIEKSPEGNLIFCADEPGLKLRILRGSTVSKRGLKHYPRQSIFIDGAFGGPPFMNNRRRQYSLDHHAGCVRSFMLASCEQAAAMVFHGLPLDEGSWLLVVNGIDLDAILATWVLMNYAQLRRDHNRLLGEIMPFVRTEGVIDGHGLEAGVLTALNPETLARTEAQIKAILPASRLSSSLAETILLQGTIRLLDLLDSMLIPAEILEDMQRITELGRMPIARGRMAVASTSALGVYEVEEYYKHRYGESFGILLLKRGDNQYTIRLASGFFDADIEELFARLNRLDPAVSSSREEENRWGGSSDIGGSPRLSGSGLDTLRILSVIAEVYGEKIPFWARLFRHFL